MYFALVYLRGYWHTRVFRENTLHTSYFLFQSLYENPWFHTPCFWLNHLFSNFSSFYSVIWITILRKCHLFPSCFMWNSNFSNLLLLLLYCGCIWLVYQLCQELTGELPPDFPMAPGEQPPVFRRRVGTAFSLSVKNIQDTDQVTAATLVSICFSLIFFCICIYTLQSHLLLW